MNIGRYYSLTASLKHGQKTAPPTAKMPSEGAVSVCPAVAVGQPGGLIYFARVLFGSQQTVVIGRIGRFDFEEPACAVRVAVGSFRCTG